MTDLICPACGVNALMVNSTGDELLCAHCKKQIGLYDKSKYRPVPSWAIPPLADNSFNR